MQADINRQVAMCHKLFKNPQLSIFQMSDIHVHGMPLLMYNIGIFQMSIWENPKFGWRPNSEYPNGIFCLHDLYQILKTVIFRKLVWTWTYRLIYPMTSFIWDLGRFFLSSSLHQLDCNEEPDPRFVKCVHCHMAMWDCWSSPSLKERFWG